MTIATQPTYEHECALRLLLPFDGDNPASQRTSVEAVIYLNTLYVHCGHCTLRHALTTEEPTSVDLPQCLNDMAEY